MILLYQIQLSRDSITLIIWESEMPNHDSTDISTSLVYPNMVPRGRAARREPHPTPAAGGGLGLVDESGDFLEGVHPAEIVILVVQYTF